MHFAQKFAENLERIPQRGLISGVPCWTLATALIVPFVCAGIYAGCSLHYVLSMNELLWSEVSNQYDKNGDARFNVEELMAVFNMSSSTAAGSYCITREQVLQWILGVDNEHDGVDREELLLMFRQLSPLLLPASSGKRLQQLVSLSKYLKFGQFFALLLCMLLLLLMLLFGSWLWRTAQNAVTREAQLKRETVVQRWKSAKDATKLDRLEKKSSAVQQWQSARNAIKLDHLKNKAERESRRLMRANVEMVRLTEERRRNAEEKQNAEEELNECKRLIDLMEGKTYTPTRMAHFLYASPLIDGHCAPRHALKVEDEYNILQGALARSGFDALQLHVDLASKKKLIGLLLSNVPRLCLHLSCHGKAGCIFLEDEFGREVAFSASNLRNLVGRTRSRNLEVAVLMSCSSQEFGHALLEAGFDYVVCTNDEILDRSARCFTEEFWTKLSHPEVSVEEAFLAARTQLQVQATTGRSSLDAKRMVLMRNASRSPKNQRSFSAPLLQRRNNLSSKSLLSGMYYKPEDFIGRQRECCQLLHGFRDCRAMCLHGEEGIGKTALMAFFACYASSQGRRFSDGVLYDPAQSAQACASEPLLWRFLELVWLKLGRLIWQQESTGLQPDCPSEVLLERLCEELIELQRKCWEQPSSSGDVKGSVLLVVDDADSLTCDEMNLLLAILEKTQVYVLLAARKPWDRDIGNYKVRHVRLDGLDSHSSATLFLRRVRRHLDGKDFERFGFDAHAIRDTFRDHVQVLQQLPLLRKLAGHPGQIRKTAEQVVNDGPSLYDLYNSMLLSHPEPANSFVQLSRFVD